MSLFCVQLSHTQNKIQAFHHSLRDYELAPTSLPQSSALATFLNPADQEAKSLGEKFSQVFWVWL